MFKMYYIKLVKIISKFIFILGFFILLAIGFQFGKRIIYAKYRVEYKVVYKCKLNNCDESEAYNALKKLIYDKDLIKNISEELSNKYNLKITEKDVKNSLKLKKQGEKALIIVKGDNKIIVMAIGDLVDYYISKNYGVSFSYGTHGHRYIDNSNVLKEVKLGIAVGLIAFVAYYVYKCNIFTDDFFFFRGLKN